MSGYAKVERCASVVCQDQEDVKNLKPKIRLGEKLDRDMLLI
jgi:hypothetical protein